MGGPIEVPDIVMDMRRDRNTMVQALEQYVFLWRVAADAIIDLLKIEQAKVRQMVNK